MFCTFCGSRLEAGSNFCGSCGARLDSNQGLAPEAGVQHESAQGAYDNGAAVQSAQAYFGNYSVNMQAPGHMTPIERPYSHSLTLALISIGAIIFLFIFPNLITAIICIGLSIASLVLGAVHLGKRSCAVGGFILGIIFTLFYLIFFFVIIIVLVTGYY